MKKKLLFWFVVLTLEGLPSSGNVDTYYSFPDTNQFVPEYAIDGVSSNAHTTLNSKQSLQIKFYPLTDTAWVWAGCTGPDLVTHNFISTPIRDSITIEPGPNSYFYYYDSLGTHISTDKYYFIVEHSTNQYEYELWFHPKSWSPFDPILISFDSIFHFHQNQFDIKLLVKLNGIPVDSLSQLFKADWGLGVKDNQKLLVAFVLSQNHPNPFNPSTRIQYQVSSLPSLRGGSSHVTLKVYDVLGNEVATLVDEYKPAGSYEVEFDARRLSSGVYFYQLRAGNYIRNKKMVVIK